MFLESIFDHEKTLKRLPFFGKVFFLFTSIVILNEINGFLACLFGSIAIVGFCSLIEQRLRDLKWNTHHAVRWTILCLVPGLNIIPLLILFFQK